MAKKANEGVTGAVEVLAGNGLAVRPDRLGALIQDASAVGAEKVQPPGHQALTAEST
jgi:hypothetical protein